MTYDAIPKVTYDASNAHTIPKVACNQYYSASSGAPELWVKF
jgi:hypothetical protein